MEFLNRLRHFRLYTFFTALQIRALTFLLALFLSPQTSWSFVCYRILDIPTPPPPHHQILNSRSSSPHLGKQKDLREVHDHHLSEEALRYKQQVLRLRKNHQAETYLLSPDQSKVLVLNQNQIVVFDLLFSRTLVEKTILNPLHLAFSNDRFFIQKPYSTEIYDFKGELQKAVSHTYAFPPSLSVDGQTIVYAHEQTWVIETDSGSRLFSLDGANPSEVLGFGVTAKSSKIFVSLRVPGHPSKSRVKAFSLASSEPLKIWEQDLEHAQIIRFYEDHSTGSYRILMESDDPQRLFIAEPYLQ